LSEPPKKIKAAKRAAAPAAILASPQQALVATPQIDELHGLHGPHPEDG
jgi:hypothetical protein